MNQHRLRHTLRVLILLVAALACVLPGQTLQPAPMANPVSIESAVAGTAQAAATQTEQAKPVPDILTGFPAAAPTSSEVISSYGTSLVKLEDGSTQFRDYRSGVQLIFPANWLLIRVGEPEYYEASEQYGAQNPWFLEEIGWLQSEDLDVYRVHAYDWHAEHLLYNVIPKISVIFQQGDKRSLDRVEADEKRAVETSGRTGHEFLSSTYQTIPGGLQALIFEDQAQSKASTGVEFMFYHKGTFFNVSSGMVFIDLYMPAEQKDALGAEYQQVIESITLFTH